MCWGSRCQVVLVPVLALWVCGSMQQPSLSFSTGGAQAESFKNGGAWTNGVKAETERKRQQSVSGEKTCGLTDPAAWFPIPKLIPLSSPLSACLGSFCRFSQHPFCSCRLQPSAGLSGVQDQLLAGTSTTHMITHTAHWGCNSLSLI